MMLYSHKEMQMSEPEYNKSLTPAGVDPNWKNIYRIGGLAAVLILLTSLAEILITFLPGGYIAPLSVTDWFALFHNNWFLGLRNLGLLNIVMTTLEIPMLFAIYAAHRNAFAPYATLALIVAFLGIATFYATNRAFPMLDLSARYASASTAEQRATIAAAGEAMLAVGRSHSPGTFLAFFLIESGAILLSVVMLLGNIFSKPTAYFGIVSCGLLLLFDICVSFVPSLAGAMLIVAMLGGISAMVWYFLVARRLLQIASSLNAGGR